MVLEPPALVLKVCPCPEEYLPLAKYPCSTLNQQSSNCRTLRQEFGCVLQNTWNDEKARRPLSAVTVCMDGGLVNYLALTDGASRRES